MSSRQPDSAPRRATQSEGALTRNWSPEQSLPRRSSSFPSRYLRVFLLTGIPSCVALALLWRERTLGPWLALLPFLLIHGLIPALDHLLGPDPTPAISRNQLSRTAQRWKAMDWPVFCLPAWLLTLFGTVTVLALGGAEAGAGPQAGSGAGLIWWFAAFSVGAAGGILAINPAHELIHRSSPFQRRCGGWLLAAVCYGAFKIEHVRGHHLWVGTDRDTASAYLGQNLYHFIIRSVAGTLSNALRLENKRCANARHQGLARILHNEFWQLNALSVLFAAAIYLIDGWRGVGFFALVSLIAVLELEIINYIEHYGLRRKRGADGRYEPVTEQHSWNVNQPIANSFLFNLQRHSDHHMNPGREYLALRSLDKAPQLPAGYGSMVLLALIPPLWFKIMNPRVEMLNP